MFAKRKVQLLLAFAILLLALAVGCTGFFQNPQIVTLTVGPQNASIQQGSNLQMSAIGTFDDGSTKTLSSNVFWSSSDTAVAPITPTGLVTAASSGTSTITASSGATTGTTTLTVTLMNVTGITVTPSSRSVPLGGTTTYTCLATVSGQSQQVDISASVTWTVTTSGGATANNISITNQQSPATVTVNSNATPGNYTVTATYITNSQTFTNSATLVVQ